MGIHPENGVAGDALVEAAALAESWSKHPISLSIKNAYGKDIPGHAVFGVDELWTEGRPARPATPAWILPKEYAGFSPAEKLERLRGKLKELGLSLIHI